MAAAATAVRDGQTALALRLTKYLAPGDGEKADVVRKNVAFSPVSVHAGLAIVAAGARGATLAQLLHFLGAPTANGLAAFGRRVAERILADRADSGGPFVLYGGVVRFDTARGALQETFQKVAAKSYKSEARTVAITDQLTEEALEIINRRVQKAIIDSIFSVSEITADTDLVLTNAVYFKGKWTDPFCSYHTRPGKFHLLDGERVVEADFMLKIHFMHVSCMDGFKVLKLPYEQGHANGEAGALPPVKRRCGRTPKTQPAEADDDTGTQFSMFVFLPDKPDGIANMVDMITASPEYLYSVLPKEIKPVDIKLPKFKISFNWNLGSDLRRLGLTLPFSKEVGDLRDMYAEKDDRPTFVSKVTHKALVKVNEQGTEPGAVMWCRKGGDGPPPDLVEFVADHPFTFLIMEERSGVIVFAGHVLDPTRTN